MGVGVRVGRRGFGVGVKVGREVAVGVEEAVGVRVGGTGVRVAVAVVRGVGKVVAVAVGSGPGDGDGDANEISAVAAPVLSAASCPLAGMTRPAQPTSQNAMRSPPMTGAMTSRTAVWRHISAVAARVGV